ncbi:MAG: BglII/BstYI family type II restriction endonuclease [Candidatus Methanoperedens sp.]|nr:BglII/BstYI family type II restriction endonuclease [Candidatus Methanoperedens sp.]
MRRKDYLSSITIISTLIMKYKESYFFCSQHLLRNVAEVQEVFSCIDAIKWLPEFEVEQNGIQYKNKTAYNKAFEIEILKYNWKQKPIFSDDTKSIGEYQKNGVFVEIQFGSSETIYRDYYKFHNGFAKNIISLAILIVPTIPTDFFPIHSNVRNIAEFDFAHRIFKLLPIPVPILLIGLLPEN